ncbi:mediator of RNA polymerase II transcription subunit 22 [Penicillium waksmanii]|uniref:mediator of RNA polymerase II transcription subunit 22 n=1 Tax=Penicillium waksmanii TaxID=69791 RepID=UPI002549A80D|nr:mediator of RNA polymerase II transcription subunit 22 [Penicillium waksmanii]KAJ5988349.1 mediator of RNA polymerase II transcription subunit 22 [Penicillium waksmanii]
MKCPRKLKTGLEDHPDPLSQLPEMDTQPNAKALHTRINTDISQLLQRFENIMATATAQNTTHTSTAVETYQLDVESTALVRAAEDILSLTRTMKEMWLFGKLETIGENERDIERREQLEKNIADIQKAIEGGTLTKRAFTDETKNLKK